MDAEQQRLQHERIGERMLSRTRAFGKLILFGEHFVVYKVPALVGAVSAYTDCEFEWTDEPGLQVVDERPAVPNYKVQKKEEGDKALNLVLDHFALDPNKEKGIKLTFGGTLCCASGIGASAAQVVAMARAIGHALPKELTLDQINAAGYEGEKGYHGTPSGIDNTAATFGGVLKFQRTDGAPIFDKKIIKEPIRIVYASTGITSSTTTVVADVKAKKEADPEVRRPLYPRTRSHSNSKFFNVHPVLFFLPIMRLSSLLLCLFSFFVSGLMLCFSATLPS